MSISDILRRYRWPLYRGAKLRGREARDNGQGVSAEDDAAQTTQAGGRQEGLAALRRRFLQLYKLLCGDRDCEICGNLFVSLLLAESCSQNETVFHLVVCSSLRVSCQELQLTIRDTTLIAPNSRRFVCQAVSGWKSDDERLMLMADLDGQISRTTADMIQARALARSGRSISLQDILELRERDPPGTNDATWLLPLSLALAMAAYIRVGTAHPGIDACSVVFFASSDGSGPVRLPSPFRPFLRLSRRAAGEDMGSLCDSDAMKKSLDTLLCLFKLLSAEEQMQIQPVQSYLDRYLKSRTQSLEEHPKSLADSVVTPLWEAVDGNQFFFRNPDTSAMIAEGRHWGLELCKAMEDQFPSERKKQSNEGKQADEWLRDQLQSHIDVFGSEPVCEEDIKTVALLDSGVSGGLDGEFKQRLQCVNFSTDDRDAFKDCTGHGTHTVGLLATGTTTAHSKIIAIKVTDRRKLGEEVVQPLIKALEYCLAKRVDIIVMPLGIRIQCPQLVDLVDEILNKRILIFAAASNDGANHGEPFPAKFARVFSIRATNALGTPLELNPKIEDHNKSFSVLGQAVPSFGLSCGRAEGQDVGVYTRKTGTSMATTIAAARAATALTFIAQQDRVQRRNLSEKIKGFNNFLPVLKLLADDNHYMPPTALSQVKAVFYAQAQHAHEHQYQ